MLDTARIFSVDPELRLARLSRPGDLLTLVDQVAGLLEGPVLTEEGYMPVPEFYAPPPSGTLTANVWDSYFTNGVNYSNWHVVGNATKSAAGVSLQANQNSAAYATVPGLTANKTYWCRARFSTRVGVCSLRLPAWGDTVGDSPESDLAGEGGAAVSETIPGVGFVPTADPSPSTNPPYVEVYLKLTARRNGENTLLWQLDGSSGAVVLTEFSVFPEPTYLYRLAVKGDTYGYINLALSKKVNSAILARQPHGVLQVGDSSDTNVSPETSVVSEVENATLMLLPWKVIPTFGNHDASYGRAGWLGYYGITPLNSGGATYWRRLPDEHGPIHIFALNNVSSADGGGVEGSSYNQKPYGPQLARALDRSTAAWKLVLCHYPVVSSGNSGKQLLATDTYDGANTWNWTARRVTAIISGHYHGQERFLRDGVTYLTVGLGGASNHHNLNSSGSAGSVFRSLQASGAAYWTGYGLWSFGARDAWYEYYVVGRNGVVASDPATHVLVDRVKFSYI